MSKQTTKQKATDEFTAHNMFRHFDMSLLD